MKSTMHRIIIGSVIPMAVVGSVLAAPAASADTTYTLADVQKHATATDCWSAVNGSVYNLTTWIPRHEGGAAVIKAMCGLDASVAFNAQHGAGRGGDDDDESEPAQALARYRIGTLAASAATTTAATTFTAADVAKHASAADCWTIVSGSVYNLTNWIKQHPGGVGPIEGMCGVDATAAYLAQHQGDKSPTAALNQFKVGTVGTGGGAAAPTTGGTTTATKTYTMRQVRRHNTAANCWSAVNRKVYDLTTWISQHPGGKQAIRGMCGRNATSAFNAQHGGARNVSRILSGYLIGKLA